jgi:hypothetical protein
LRVASGSVSSASAWRHSINSIAVSSNAFRRAAVWSRCVTGA